MRIKKAADATAPPQKTMAAAEKAQNR